MEVYKYHSNITQKRHGAIRNYRYILDVSVLNQINRVPAENGSGLHPHRISYGWQQHAVYKGKNFYTILRLKQSFDIVVSLL